MTRLTDLPEELLLQCAESLDALDDVHRLSLTCRLLNRIVQDISPATISRQVFALRYSIPGLRPFPHLLLAFTASDLADWVARDAGNKEVFSRAVRGGIYSLCKLALDVSHLTLADIRRMWQFKVDVLSVVAAEMDRQCGPATRHTIFQTVCEDVEGTLLIWATYGELFKDSFALGPTKEGNLALDCVARFQFLLFCVPDENSFVKLGVTIPTHIREAGHPEYYDQIELQHAMRHFLTPQIWSAALRSHALENGQAIPTGSAVDLTCEYYVQHAGLKSLEILTRNGRKRLRGWLDDLRNHVDSLYIAGFGNSTADSPVGSDPWVKPSWPTLRDGLAWTLDEEMVYEPLLEHETGSMSYVDWEAGLLRAIDPDV